MANNKIHVAITQGDPNGIGYELILKTFAEPEMLELCTPIIYGSTKIASRHRDVLQVQCQFNIIKNANEARENRVNLLPCCNEVKVDFGQSSEEATSAADKAFRRAFGDVHEGLCDVLVCGPTNEGAQQIKDENILHVYIDSLTRIAFADGQISQEDIITKVKVLHKTMKRDFRLSNPRIAVLALNKEIGNEEQEIIVPAIQTLEESNIKVFGPYQAEDFFESRKYEAFDAILAMNSDQVRQEPNSVVALANTPLVCTMPDSDAQYEIAGKNEADEAMLRNAIYTAIDIFRYRKEYDGPMANPLPKLYHERPDNGEKLRFSIPKKKEE